MMTHGELLYLVMTLAAFGAFMATLAYADHRYRATARVRSKAVPRATGVVGAGHHAR